MWNFWQDLRELATQDLRDEEDRMFVRLSLRSIDVERFISAYFSNENGFADLTILEFAHKTGFDITPEEIQRHLYHR